MNSCIPKIKMISILPWSFSYNLQWWLGCFLAMESFSFNVFWSTWLAGSWSCSWSYSIPLWQHSVTCLWLIGSWSCSMPLWQHSITWIWRKSHLKFKDCTKWILPPTSVSISIVFKFVLISGTGILTVTNISGDYS